MWFVARDINTSNCEVFMRRSNATCLECGKGIYRRPFQLTKGPVFCTRKCANVRNKRPEVKCAICDNVVDRNKRAKYCSKICANAAIRRFPRKPRSDKPRNWRYLLIVGRGGKCNRCPTDYVAVLEVHHIIERCNGGTDEEENLEVLCPTCHAIHHHEIRIKGKVG